jgi:hypothetical protein
MFNLEDPINWFPIMFFTLVAVYIWRTRRRVDRRGNG